LFAALHFGRLGEPSGALNCVSASTHLSHLFDIVSFLLP